MIKGECFTLMPVIRETSCPFRFMSDQLYGSRPVENGQLHCKTECKITISYCQKTVSSKSVILVTNVEAPKEQLLRQVFFFWTH